MKKILACIQFLLLAIAANATGQEGDIIYIDGTRWELLGRPVSRDSVLYHHLKAVLPSNRSISTANWDGFTAYWSIVQDVLCLDSMRCEHYDANCREYIAERIPNDTLLRVFKNWEIFVLLRGKLFTMSTWALHGIMSKNKSSALTMGR